MQSQKRAIKELDIYGRGADRLLQLEPNCCQAELTEEQQKLLTTYNEGYLIISVHCACLCVSLVIAVQMHACRHIVMSYVTLIINWLCN